MTAPVVCSTHGSYRMVAGCGDCREYQRVRNAKNRLDRLTSGRISHGTRSGYDAGCRCPGCLETRAVAYRREASRAAS